MKLLFTTTLLLTLISSSLFSLEKTRKFGIGFNLGYGIRIPNDDPFIPALKLESKYRISDRLTIDNSNLLPQTLVGTLVDLLILEHSIYLGYHQPLSKRTNFLIAPGFGYNYSKSHRQDKTYSIISAPLRLGLEFQRKNNSNYYFGLESRFQNKQRRYDSEPFSFYRNELVFLFEFGVLWFI